MNFNGTHCVFRQVSWLLGFLFHYVRCTSPVCVCLCFCAVIQKLDYVFAENGLVAYKNGQLLSVQVRFPWDFRLCRPQKPTVEAVLGRSVFGLSAFSPSRDTWEKTCFKSSSTSVSTTWPRSSCPRRGPTESPSLCPLCFDPVCGLDGFYALLGGRSSNSGMECWTSAPLAAAARRKRGSSSMSWTR